MSAFSDESRLASASELAMDVTLAAMTAAINAVPRGDTVTPEQAEGILLGLMRASARWCVMIAPPMMDGGFERSYAMMLQQERKAQQDTPPETVQ